MTGSMDDKIKNNIIKTINKEWLKYDVVIYTTVITMGISFDEIHFDCGYMFGCGGSATS